MTSSDPAAPRPTENQPKAEAAPSGPVGMRPADFTLVNPGIDQRRFAPATERNRAPILALLARVLPAAGTVLEVASGTGEHAIFFGPRLPHLSWQPTDLDAASRAS